jgi:tektin-1
MCDSESVYVILSFFRLNRRAKYLLEKDLKDKFQAQDIDEYCENLKNNSHGLKMAPGCAKIEAK